MGRIEVYLCDDVAALRLVLRTVLELEPSISVVGESGDGEVALAEIEELQPDVAVLDLSLPGLDGLELLDLLAGRSTRTRVIVFSGYPREQLEEAVLARGARRYLEKGVDLDAVVTAIREVAAEAA
jgi:DNA-binding NarL/FixJ family response regulator